MRRPLRWVAAAALGACAFGAWAWGPLLLSRVEWFEIREVEISGTRLLAPHEVLAASGVTQGQNLWNDRRSWERRLEAHSGIASARVSRRLPRTLRIRIDEKRPVAYVEAGVLRLATASGELLPVDPSRRPLDLPIVRADWTDSAQSAVARRLLAVAGRLEMLDPALLAQVSEIRATRTGTPGVVLVHPLGDLVIPDGTDAGSILELRAVLADLQARTASGEPSQGIRVDLRYDDQVVVRFPSSV